MKQISIKKSSGKMLVILNQNGSSKVIGIIKNKAFIRNIKPQHIFKKGNAIGINKELVDKYKHLFNRVVVFCEDKVYKISLDDLLNYGVDNSEGGYERQLFVPIAMWKTEKLIPQ